MSFLSAFVARQSLRPPVVQHVFVGYAGSIARAKTFVRHNHSLLAPARLHGTSTFKSLFPWLATGITVAGVGLGLSTLYRHPILCDSPGGSPKLTPATSANPATPTGDSIPPPPQSSVSLSELSFGTVAGVCAGVFVKKGAKMAAWFLGGIFVLLQYLNSASVVRVDWSRIAHKFENLFYTTEASGAKKPPTVGSLWNWLVNFLTADFQPRASFLAGFALGLRVG